MSIADVDLLWQVEVQLPNWRSWSPAAGRRLRAALEGDPEVVRVIKVVPLAQRLLLRSIAPTVTIELVADSPAAASASAVAIVGRSLEAIGRAGPAIPWIVGTQGKPPSERPRK
jgi:hypothetical protein